MNNPLNNSEYMLGGIHNNKLYKLVEGRYQDTGFFFAGLFCNHLVTPEGKRLEIVSTDKEESREEEPRGGIDGTNR